MKNIKISFLFLCTILFAVSCKKDEGIQLADSDYLVFGHFYGFCGGEECIEVFRLESNRLLEDSNDTYPNANQNTFYAGNYAELSTATFNDVKDVVDYFPSELLNESATVIGTPDAADGGGLYIEYNYNGTHDYWLIDQVQSGVPAYLHPFMNKVNEKIALINN